MDIQNSKTPASIGASNNGARTWRESVSSGMRTVEAVIRELSQNDVPVLVVAESGSGKQAAGARIHALSQRHAEPFQVCHGNQATQEILGSWEAEGGTVYLQDVGDLDAASQAELVRQIALRGDEERRVPRFICGTSRELEAEVKAGKVREDLYYRISGVCLRLPPLRQRREDITGLVQMFLRKYADEFLCPVPVLTETTERLFREYGWPGNIREIEDAARAIVAMGSEALAMSGLRSVLAGEGGAAPAERISLKQVSRAASREAERELILKALTRTRWNRKRAAQDLQISYKALLYKLKQIGIQEQGAL